MVSPSATAMTRRDRALGRDDRRHDATPCRSPARRTSGWRPTDVADTGEQEQPEADGVDRGRVGTHGAIGSADDHARRPSPRPRTTREPIIRLEREEHEGGGRPQHGSTEAAEMAITRSSVGVWPGRGASVRASTARGPRARACGTIRLRARRTPRAARSDTIPIRTEVRPPWPRRPAPGQALARRQDSSASARPQSRHDVLQPRRSAAKTYVAKALTAAAHLSTIDHDPDGRPARGAQRPRPRGQGRCHPPERRRAPQVAPDPQGQRRARWRPMSVRRPVDQADRQGRRREGRQGPHRRRQGRQGQGRPDRRRQGPRRAEQDGPRRGRRRQGRRRGRAARRSRPKAAAKATTKAPPRRRPPTEDGRQGRAEGRAQEGGRGAAKATAKAAPKAKKPAATK